MRHLETLLVLGNLVTFLVLAIPRLHAARWRGSIIVITLSLAVVQLIVEGPRWQMYPAYGLAGLLSLAWLLWSFASAASPIGQIMANRFVISLSVGLGIVVLVVSIALPTVLPVFHFPKPTGPYGIGTLIYHWVDTSRRELFTTDPNDHRELMAQVWYPAQSEPSSPRAPYIKDADAVTPAMARLLHMPGFVFSHLKYVTTNAVASAPVADNQSRYPVLIYLTGVDGFRSVNTFQIEALVSHGYIVVGLDQPGIAPSVRFPDGRQIAGWSRDEIQPLIMQSVEAQPNAPTLYGKSLPDGIIPYFAQDASFALDQLTEINEADPYHILTGRLDLEHAGTFGVSLGGMDAAEACLKDPRLKACLIMDVWMPADVVKSGLQQSSMFITRDADTMRLERSRIGGWSERDIALTLGTMQTVYQDLPGDGYYVEIPGMFHVNFTDLPYWSPIMSQLGMTGPIDGQRGFDIVNAYSVAFFDKALKGQSSALLEGPAAEYPEVIFSSRSLGHDPPP